MLSYAYHYALLVGPLGGTREALGYPCARTVLALWAIEVRPALLILRASSAYPVGPVVGP